MTLSAALHPSGKNRRRVIACIAFGFLLSVGGNATPEPRRETVPLASGHPAFSAHRYPLHDGATLAYYVRPGHPTLVLIPGTGRDRRRFLDSGFVDRLAPGYGVVIIETRGRGQSWPPPEPAQATIPQYANDALEVVRGLKLDAWYISGHSLGGMIAWEIAGRRPEGLRGAIPLEGWIHYSVAEAAFGEDVTPPGGSTVAKKPKDVPPGWTEAQEIALITMWRRWSGGEAAVERTQCPVLAINGDRNLSPRPSRRVLKLPDDPNVSLHWVAGAGHDILAPAFVAETTGAVNEFIAGVERRRTQP